jgi:hypothetical protein
MNATLDGQDLFEGHAIEIEAGSLSRDSVEKAAPGLDGVLSIDLGGRGRRIKQRGVLRTTSRSQMDGKIGAISAHIDGKTHTLVDINGGRFEDLRMDAFEVTTEKTSGGGIVADYEIVYTQLV